MMESQVDRLIMITKLMVKYNIIVESKRIINLILWVKDCVSKFISISHLN
jgi:hypothetical protein